MTPDEMRSHIAEYGIEHALASLANEVNAAQERVGELEREIRAAAESIDTMWTPPWKKFWFWIDGWPLYRLADSRRRRPWHRSR